MNETRLKKLELKLNELFEEFKDLSDEELCWVIMKLEMLKDKTAWRLFKHNTQTDRERNLRWIIFSANSPYLKAKAAEELFEKYSDHNANLRFLIKFAPVLRKKIAKKLFNQNPSKLDLRCVMECEDPSLREEAWQIYLSKNPDEYDLKEVIFHVSHRDIVEKAEKLLWELRKRRLKSQQ